MAGQVTRERLVASALQLFTTQGYDTTPVQAVIDAAGVSKGAFYHHFSAKDELLDAVVEGLTSAGVAQLTQVVMEAGPSAVARFVALFQASSAHWVADPGRMRGLYAVLYTDENMRLRWKMQQRSVEQFLPLLAQILAEGTARGELSVAEPTETARLILQLGHAVGETQMADLRRGSADADVLTTRADVHLRSVERIVGAVPGVLGSLPRPVFSLLVAIFATPPEPS